MAIKLAYNSLIKLTVSDAINIYYLDSVYMLLERIGPSDNIKLYARWEVTFLLDKEYLKTAKIKGYNIPNEQIPEEVVITVDAYSGKIFRRKQYVVAHKIGNILR